MLRSAPVSTGRPLSIQSEPRERQRGRTSIRNLNLNLLLVLDALSHEQNVTRAAKGLGLTQSAVCNALGQLRQALGDPLFVRSRRGVVPTNAHSRWRDPYGKRSARTNMVAALRATPRGE